MEALKQMCDQIRSPNCENEDAVEQMMRLEHQCHFVLTSENEQRQKSRTNTDIDQTLRTQIIWLKRLLHVMKTRARSYWLSRQEPNDDAGAEKDGISPHLYYILQDQIKVARQQFTMLEETVALKNYEGNTKVSREIEMIHVLKKQVDDICAACIATVRQMEMDGKSPARTLRDEMFSTPKKVLPTPEYSIVQNLDKDPEAKEHDESDQESFFEESQSTLSPVKLPVAPIKLSPEELRKQEAARLEEEIQEMTQQLKLSTMTMHSTLKDQTKGLDEIQDAVINNLDSVSSVTETVTDRNRRGWGKKVATWTLFFSCLGTFVFLCLTMRIMPKRQNACLFGCKRGQSRETDYDKRFEEWARQKQKLKDQQKQRMKPQDQEEVDNHDSRKYADPPKNKPPRKVQPRCNDSEGRKLQCGIIWEPDDNEQAEYTNEADELVLAWVNNKRLIRLTERLAQAADEHITDIHRQLAEQTIESAMSSREEKAAQLLEAQREAASRRVEEAYQARVREVEEAKRLQEALLNEEIRAAEARRELEELRLAEEIRQLEEQAQTTTNDDQRTSAEEDQLKDLEHEILHDYHDAVNREIYHESILAEHVVKAQDGTTQYESAESGWDKYSEMNTAEDLQDSPRKLGEDSARNEQKTKERLAKHGASVEARIRQNVANLIREKHATPKTEDQTQEYQNNLQDSNNEQLDDYLHRLEEEIELELDFHEHKQETFSLTQKKVHAEMLRSGAREGDEDLVTELLHERPAAVNDYDENGWTALHEAARAGHNHVAEILLDAGASVNMRSNLGVGATPLFLSISHHGENHPCSQLLRSRGGVAIAPKFS